MRKMRAVFFVLEIIQDNLETYDGNCCGKADLPEVIEQTAVFDIDKKLPYIDGNRQKHQRVKIAFCSCRAQIQHSYQEDNKRNIPPEVSHELGNIGGFMHYQNISCPIVIT